MDDKSQPVNIVNIAVVLLTVGLGYAFVRGNMGSPRPSPLEGTHIPDPEDTNKVESRLWQDPFEPFESATNRGAAGQVQFDQVLWNEIASRADIPDDSSDFDFISPQSNAATPIAIVGVMLEGGSYAEQKEVRLRLRYAVEVALLAWGLGPEDRTHISTNAVWLTRSDGGQEHGRFSKFAYEWFGTRSDVLNCQACVLWLNEDDFADNPMLRLDSLLNNIPALTNTNLNVSFYLIGPRSSDTLRTLALSATNVPHGLHLAAAAQRFHILSPEATASVHDKNLWDPSDTNSWDPYGRNFQREMDKKLGTNVFQNWIATDERLADLIARELTNRTAGAQRETNDVVVLLSEQDTFFGSRLADEWAQALVTNRVCSDYSNIWQFSYLRGLDGSKPPKEKPPEQPSGAAATPEAALQAVLDQQQHGQKADGNAQLDYIVRLGDFLRRKDQERKEQGRGQIVAVGLTGSDSYDKLTLLRELRGRLPEAVFFTTDLDAPLWTANELPYTRNLLVASAYPLEPDPDNDSPDLMEANAPFRDVYQAAVFRACNALAAKHRIDRIGIGSTSLAADFAALSGSLYKLGREGPIRLPTMDDPEGTPKWTPTSTGVVRRWVIAVLGAISLGAAIMFFAATAKNGFRRASPVQGPLTPGVQEAEDEEQSLQMPASQLVMGMLAALGILVLCWVFFSIAKAIATLPGEEPWDFHGGVSIWPTEWIRFGAVLSSLFFFFFAWWRRLGHRKKLWLDYFRTENQSPGYWDEFWSKFVAEPKTGGRRRNWLIAFWMPPFVESANCSKPVASVDAERLFKDYLKLGLFRVRFGRICLELVGYTLPLLAVVYCLAGRSAQLVVRGALSRQFDHVLLLLSLVLFLFVLGYVLDAALLTGRLLNCISRYPTRWPDRPLLECATAYGVRTEHLDGMLDVDFAATQTKEVGPLMFGPVLILLILALARSTYFDNWTWPPILILVFVVNFVAGALCWWVVRRAAARVRELALKRLDRLISSVKNSREKDFEVLPSESLQEFKKPPPGALAEIKTPALPRQEYVKRLKAVKKAIQDENRGAYARAFQDPTYLAVFIPTGASGIITLIASLWLK